MRIAIYEPEPRVCGPMSWAYHLKEGFEQLGHECDVITFTRSGKMRQVWGEGMKRNGIRWWGRTPDAVAPMRKSRPLADSYDRIILSDVRTIMQDDEARKGKGYVNPDIPEYLSVLMDTDTPFTFALHGNNYPPSEVQYADRLVALPNFTGRAVTHSPTSPELSSHVWPDVTWLGSPLPYHPKHVGDDRELAAHLDGRTSGVPVAGITGRYISTKGSHALAMAAGNGHVPAGTRVELHGTCSMSLAASASYKTYEALHLGKPLSLDGQRFGIVKPGERVETGGDTLRHYPWRVSRPDGTIISYHSGYESGFQVSQRLDVHVDLTASKFSDGMEYSQFESMDAGCLQVAVASMWSDDFEGISIPAVERWASEQRLIKDYQDLLDTIGSAVALAIAAPTEKRADIVAYNRQVLRTKHSPSTVAATFLRALDAA